MPPSIDLVEVLGGELDRDRVVGQVGVGRRGGRGDLDRRVEADALAARDVRELQPVDVALIEVVAGRHDELGGQVGPLAVGAGAGLPADVHAVGIEEVDLALGIDEPAAAGSHARAARAAAHGRGRILRAARRRRLSETTAWGRSHFLRPTPGLVISESVASGRCRQQQHSDRLHGTPPTPATEAGRPEARCLRSADRGERLSS